MADRSIREIWEEHHKDHSEGTVVLVKEGSNYRTFGHDAQAVISLNLTLKFAPAAPVTQTDFSFHADQLNAVLHALWRVPKAVIVVN